jgi:hypothetical protein
MGMIMIDGKYYMVQEKPKLPQREALSQIKTLMLGVEGLTPTERQKFQRIDVAKLSATQVTAILKQIKNLVNPKK